MIILDKEDLVNLVKGTYCPYELMEEFSKKGYGYYTGGFVDDWFWNSSKLKELDEDTLIKIYNRIKSYGK